MLLAPAERAVWQQILCLGSQPSTLSLSESCSAVSQRALQTLKWAEESNLSLLTIVLDKLTLVRAALYETILEGSAALRAAATPTGPSTVLPRREIDAAVDSLRRAGTQDHLPLGLLTRAC